MSTILKALRRLEEEKARGGAPRPLREEVASGPRERPRRRGAPVALLGALVIGAGIGASAWYFWPYERAAEPLDVAALEVPGPAAEAAGGIAAPGAPQQIGITAPGGLSDEQALGAVAEDAGALPDDAFASPVEVVQRPPAEPRIAPVAPKPGAASPEAATERRMAVARRRALARAAEADPIANPPPAPARAAAPAPPVRAAATPAARLPAASPAPVTTRPAEPEPAVRQDDQDWPVTSEWVEPPLEPEPTRIDGPGSASSSTPVSTEGAEDVRVKRTQWHPEHARRSAEIELAGKDRSVREGDVVGDYVVNEIKPSGVVLMRDGEQIERGIGAK